MTLSIAPDFSAASTTIAGALAAYFTFGEPWLGRRIYGSLARRREAEPRALVRYFGLSLGLWWAVAGLGAAVLLLSPGVRAADLGLRLPDDPLFSYLVAAGLVALALASARMMRRLAAEDKHVPGRDAIAAMLPRTRAERRLATAVAVSDGVVGELLYRGLLIAFGVGVLGLNLYVAAAISLAIYSAAGWYQGWGGVLTFALFGLAPTALYLATGSLLVPVIYHVTFAVRDLVLLPADKPLPKELGSATA